ncbi:MAG: hypothetical protein WCO45_14435 [Pseudanabaena sp. ELA607]
MHKSQWLAKLTAFSNELYQNQPIPERITLTPEEESQCRMIGGDFISWQQNNLSHILMERHALRIKRFDPEPIIVFTSTTPGLVAAKQIINHVQDDLNHIIYLPHDDFKQWEQNNPIEEMTFHIHQWSYFQGMSSDLMAMAAERHGAIAPRDLRVHITGELWGERCGMEQAHLWFWDGQELELLEESFSYIRF